MKDMLSRGLKGFNNFSIFNDQCTLTVSTTNDGTVPNGVAIGILNVSGNIFLSSHNQSRIRQRFTVE